ncbi:LysE family translocator [Streptomyces sp. NPDC048644]|uniref:LysE family translocator n=1 Tax=Streptomyces sp. NPDC048644 TaxID=3365582 RepID=UPI003718D732
MTASGLAAFLAASTAILNLLRVVGGGYLVLLGALSIFSVVHRPRRQSITPQSAPGNVRTAALQGFLNNVLNPKALIFYLTFMPQFLVQGSAFEQSLLLGGLVVLCAAAWWTLYVTAIGYLSTVLTRKTVRTAIDVGAGVRTGRHRCDVPGRWPLDRALCAEAEEPSVAAEGGGEADLSIAETAARLVSSPPHAGQA